MLTAIDLCCGAGGWIAAARGLPIRFVMAADWSEDCCLTVKYNHPHVPVVRADVRQLDFTRFRGKVDLMLGAVPCEEVSVARAGRPASEAAIASWQELIDAMVYGAGEMRAKWWALENVIQMRRHLPILTPYQVLDSRHWSSQNRRRIFVGDFPRPATGIAGRLVDFIRPGPYTVTKTILRSTLKTRRQWYTQGARRVLDPAKPSPTITDFGSSHSRGFVITTADGRERVLTLQEAALLQGFPEDYVFVCAPSRAFKLVGQAVQIDTARAILQAICREAGVLAA